MGDPLTDLAAAIAPYDRVRGPSASDVGATAVVRVGGATEVTIELAASGRATASAASPDAAPLYVDLELDPLGAVRVHTSDAGFATVLIAGLDARLRQVLAVGGTARLSFGTWQILRPRAGVPLRELIDTVALLAARPAAIGRAWAGAATALGATARGRWSPRGGGAITVGAVELAHRAAGDGPLRTEASLRAATPDLDRPADEPIQIGALRGAVVVEPHRRVAWLPGVVLDAADLATLVGRVGGAMPKLRAAPVAKGLPAPMAFADWPDRRAGVAAGLAADRVWTRRPISGRDPARGLDDELAIDGVAVRTSCADDARAATEVRAAAPGADGLTIDAHPGYRFLLGWLWPDPQLDDPAFDDRYVLATDDVAWTRWWLGAVERAAIAATFAPAAAHPFAFALRGAEVAFHAVALPDRHAVDAARQAAAFLATRGDRATAEWRALAGSLGATVIGERFTRDGGLALRTGRGAVVVEIAAITGGDGRLATRAAVSGAGIDAGPHLALRADHALDRLEPARGRRDRSTRGPSGYRTRTSDRSWAAERLAAIAQQLAAARPELVEVDGDHASLTWAGPVLDVARLTAGVELLARVVRAAGTAAPYR